MAKGYIMSHSSRSACLRRIHARYHRAGGAEKQRILDEFSANCAYHSKYAIRLLNGPLRSPKQVGARRQRQLRRQNALPQPLALVARNLGRET
jgi:hypothetical protein